VKVSELADRTRCTTKAVRFYEAEGASAASARAGRRRGRCDRQPAARS